MKCSILTLTLALTLVGSADEAQSPLPSTEFYTIAADKCQHGDEEGCGVLVKLCENARDAIACAHLAYSVGLRGEDEKGLKYLKLSCDGGLLEACRQIPIIKNYIKEKHEANKVVL